MGGGASRKCSRVLMVRRADTSVQEGPQECNTLCESFVVLEEDSWSARAISPSVSPRSSMSMLTSLYSTRYLATSKGSRSCSLAGDCDYQSDVPTVGADSIADMRDLQELGGYMELAESRAGSVERVRLSSPHFSSSPRVNLSTSQATMIDSRPHPLAPVNLVRQSS